MHLFNLQGSGSQFCCTLKSPWELLKILLPGTHLPKILNQFGILCDLGFRIFEASLGDSNVASVFEMT